MAHPIVYHTIAEARAASRQARSRGAVVGLVPTMGALHEGHASLIRRAADECGHVIVSIFVNPTQFDEPGDLSAYPRTLDADLEVCAACGAAAVFCPSEAEMYPHGRPLTRVSASGLTDRLCGATRPGHFDGVATVCTKLFSACEPDRAYFGEKDYQQLLVVRRLVADLNLPVEIVPCPLIREPDGLALSSRNARLSSEERAEALVISRSLFAASALFERGERSVAALVDAVRAALADLYLGEVDYVELLDADDLSHIERVDRDAVLAVAVRFPSARLIDNVILRV